MILAFEDTGLLVHWSFWKVSYLKWWGIKISSFWFSEPPLHCQTAKRSNSEGEKEDDRTIHQFCDSAT